MADRKTVLDARLGVLERREKLVLDAADREQRSLTDEDRQELAAIETDRKHTLAQIQRFDSDDAVSAAIAKLTGGGTSHGAGATPRLSAGKLFVADENVAKFFQGGGHRASGTWRSPAVEIPYASLFATTLTEDPASGGQLVIPDYRPGIVPLPTRKIVVMDLLMPGTTDSNVWVHMKETTFTNAAAPVVEGAAKPESTLVYEQVSEPVLKIAHWLPATEEILEDVAGLRSHIDGRLRDGVQLAEDDQLLNGSGVAPNFTGLLLRATAPTIAQGTDTIADAIAKQISAIANTAFAEPTGIIMNPTDWLGVRISKTSTGDYYGNGPFAAPGATFLWGLPVAVTPAIVAKTVLVGAFATQAQFLRRGGMRVEASNSHSDFFIKNLVAIRAEERGALACYRPTAFGKVTLT